MPPLTVMGLIRLLPLEASEVIVILDTAIDTETDNSPESGMAEDV